MIDCIFCDKIFNSYLSLAGHCAQIHQDKFVSSIAPKWLNAEQYTAGLAGPTLKTATQKFKILEEGLLEYRCNSCKLTEWLGYPIPLELHHKTGTLSRNFVLEELELLCPTCHSLTNNYKSKNKIGKWKSLKRIG